MLCPNAKWRRRRRKGPTHKQRRKVNRRLGLTTLRANQELTDFEDALLIWIQENHDGEDEVDTIEVLCCFGSEDFRRALKGLERRRLVTVKHGRVKVTLQGFQAWERAHGSRYGISQAAER